MSFYERLQSLAKENNKSFNQIERELNYPRNALNDYKKRKNPSAKRTAEIAEYFNVSINYLLGETDIKQPLSSKSDFSQLSEVNQKRTNSLIKKFLKEQEPPVTSLSEELFPYHVVDQALSAGLGYGYTDDLNYSTVYWNRDVDYDMATWIKGDSMEPEFYSGEVVLIKKQNVPDYNGQICAVDWDGNSFIKKVYVEDDGFVLSSINDKYADKFASWYEEPRIIGKVIEHFVPIEG
ncbi:LexA family transcriptional regulator [Lactococcus ileimucosae]|uniref:LexA family transcriptional regulator n=1 Tax=Lactococcus ileimucosae TaxID=2941329 RepID=UPI003519A11F